MKRVHLILLVATSLTCSLFAGCKKEEEVIQPATQQQSVPSINLADVCTITEQTQYDVDEVIYGTDVVDISDNNAIALLQGIVFLTEDGAVLEALPTSTEGMHTVSVIIELSNGDSHSIEYIYNVTAVVDIPDFPSRMINNLRDAEWEVGEIDIYGDISKESISYVSDTQEVYSSKYVFTESSNFAMGGGKDKWAYAIISHEDETALAYKDESPIRIPLSLLNAYKAVKEMYPDLLGDVLKMSEIDLLQKQVDFQMQFAKDNMYISTEDLPYSLYDKYGNAYPIKAMSVKVDYTDYGAEALEYYFAYYVNIDDKHRLVFVNLEDRKYKDYVGYNTYYDYGDKVDIPDNVGRTGDVPLFDDYASFVKYYEENKCYKNTMLLNQPTKSQSVAAVDRLATEIIIGDFFEDYGDVEFTPIVEDTTEEPTQFVSGVPYQVLHPEVFTWVNPSKDVFKRWYYQLYYNDMAGTLILSTGEMITLGKSTTEEADKVISTPSNPMHGYKETTQEMSSEYATYVITNSEYKSANIDEANSSDNRTVVITDTGTYYIEMTRASKISSYRNKSIYTDSILAGREFSVLAKSEEKPHPLGKMTEYYIKFTDASGAEVSRPYMVVLTTPTDYIVCYGATLPEKGSTDFLDILTNMVLP